MSSAPAAAPPSRSAAALLAALPLSPVSLLTLLGVACGLVALRRRHARTRAAPVQPAPVVDEQLEQQTGKVAASARSPSSASPSLSLPHVSIVGGGLSGLSCALSLQRAGISVTVYERDSSLSARRGGYGLTLTNSPVGALNDLEVLEDCRREDCLSTAHWVLTEDGRVRGYYGRGLQEAQASDAASSSPSPVGSPQESSASLRIPREDLRRMLYTRLQPGTVQFGYRLADYTENLSCPADEKPVTLQFEDGRTASCDLLVGADGIHSVVRKLRDAKEGDPTAGLKYLHVAVILGTSPFEHPLLNARGIYVVSGSARLFTMPFRARQYDPDTGELQSPQLTMWQLSFACPDEASARALRSAAPAEVLAKALDLTHGWMSPVADLLQATPLEEVWATPLYDRDPMRLRSREKASLVTVAGDAAHAMSMFKGQGANQALQDGPALAQWIRHQHSTRRDTPASRAAGMTRASLLTRVRQYESEIVHRSTPRVLDSRRAAAWYHSPAAAAIGPAYGLGNLGLRPGEPTVVEVLQELERQGVTAELGAGMEERAREVIQNMRQERKIEVSEEQAVKRRQVKKQAQRDNLAPIR